MSYSDFLTQKALLAPSVGLAEPGDMPAAMKRFQGDITRWAIRRGRAAIFAGTGLGKTFMQLAWGDRVRQDTKGELLILTPLAVAQQTVAEAKQWGINDVAYAKDQKDISTSIVVTNYDRLDKFKPERFAGIILDESSIIKSQDSKTRVALLDAFAETPWKLCCTATPAPNDYVELGNHAEFLGVMTQKEMLAMFFVHDGSVRAGGGADWRLKRHAEHDFWAWLASWAVVIRSPEDLGYDDEPGYDLPPLRMRQITVPMPYAPSGGFLFPLAARTLSERIGARRDSIKPRVCAALKLIVRELEHADLQSDVLREEQRDTEETITRLLSCEQAQEGQEKKDGVFKGVLQQQQGEMEPITGAATENKCEETGKICDRSRVPNTETAGSKELATAESAQAKKSTAQKIRDNNSRLSDSSSETTEYLRDLWLFQSGEEKFLSNCGSLPQNEQDTRTALYELQSRFGKISGQPSSTSPCRRLFGQKWLVWCGLNAEQDAIQRELGPYLCVSIKGSDDRKLKIEKEQQWRCGNIPVLISKPSIFGFGMNWQHCSRMIFLGLNDSFEQLFQAIRRCWRFGQTRPVDVYMIASELEGAVVENVLAKEREFERMGAAMAAHMTDLTQKAVRGGRLATDSYRPEQEMILPAWMTPN